MPAIRRSHTVWKNYLRSWSNNDQVYCLQNGRIFPSNIINMSVERDFYKLLKLTDQDIEGIKSIINGSPLVSQKFFQELLFKFSTIPYLVDYAFSDPTMDMTLRDYIEEQVFNAAESLHSSIEFNALPIFDDLKNKDISFYDDGLKSVSFLSFISVQYFRTKGIQRRVFEKKFPLINIENCWNILRIILGMNLGFSLFVVRKKRPLILIENITNVPFITSDQPVINLFSLPEANQHLALYYPISPSLALILGESDVCCGFENGSLTEEKVLELNRKIQSFAELQIYGHSEEVLLLLN